MNKPYWPLSPLEGEDVSKNLVFEIFVQPGFSDLELSAILSVLKAANDVLNRDRFSWQITSDTPGLITSSSELLVRANPAIGDQYLRDCLFVVGGRSTQSSGWMNRLRAMQKRGKPVVLLSDAAREYVKTVKTLKGPATTHWRDIELLHEIGTYPTLSERLVEVSGTILTCAGHGHTMETVVGILSNVLGPQECAEIASLLMLENIRGFTQDQPRGTSYNPNFLEKRLQRAIRIMENNIEQPLRLADLAVEVGLSARHLERLFTVYLNTSPAKLYKKIRLKKAQTLITNTRISLIEVAIACGFLSTASLSQAYKAEFGKTPNQVRKNIK
ncbi:MAG: helix-turn-helix domain-containing protein [Roseibium sp.]|uniref:GlxA family transcriptional regulator n=1 Tax=Roseibium sp. TaxID=1936156 RepID=UPI002618BA58|nr:helix-turn-helix domain-containing protein [Roseibium sp.]MCV0426972.1 helix-turn-helix domain-containing protein [Roseibium sp.]